MPIDVTLLAEVPLFSLLDEQERADLATQLDVVNFQAGQPVFNYGDPGGALYVIRTGAAEVFFKNDTGERIVLERPTVGDFFGELSLLDNGPRTASVMAAEDMETLRVDRADLNYLFRKHPGAAMDLLTAMGRRMRNTVELLRHSATRNVNEETEDKRTLIQKSADWIAEFSGSIPFLGIHIVLFALWIAWNVLPGLPYFDPFPFGFLTMCVSLEAIILSVFVLLSQNRQAAKDRVRADIEYDVNLKAELEVAHLHEKVDHLHAEVNRRLDTLERLMGRERA
jgi:uncharacterized membrane protein